MALVFAQRLEGCEFESHPEQNSVVSQILKKSKLNVLSVKDLWELYPIGFILSSHFSVHCFKEMHVQLVLESHTRIIFLIPYKHLPAKSIV